jgi:hypothetical protein
MSCTIVVEFKEVMRVPDLSMTVVPLRVDCMGQRRRLLGEVLFGPGFVSSAGTDEIGLFIWDSYV